MTLLYPVTPKLSEPLNQQMEQHQPQIRLLSTVLLTLMAGLGAAAACFAATSPIEVARAIIEKFVQTQTVGLPGKATISLTMPASNPLPPCDALEPFMPPGATPWGRVSIGLRCRADKPWTRFVPAYIAVEGRYFVAARTIDAGQPLGVADVAERTGDLTRLSRSVITDAFELHGVVTTNRIASGAPLRKELVRGVTVIRQGQTAQVVAQGPGFVISTEGKAMTDTKVGAVVQAKTRDGRLVSGVADEDGQIQLAQ